MNVIGLILMGGLNSRMGGEKKALLQYKGRCFYEHVRQAMKDAGVEELYASVEKPWDMELGMKQIVDRYEQIGPLGGIVTAISEAPGNAAGILVLPCDLPLISPALLSEMIARFQEVQKPVVLMSEGRPNPLVAIYTIDCLPVLKAQIAEGNYRATYWTHQVPHENVVLDPALKHIVSNINSMEDYSALVE